MAFETEGIVHKIFETQSKSETFKTREFVIKNEGQYPQFIKFQLTQDRCDLIETYKEGDKIKVHFDLRGREWNEKYFTNLNAWKIEKVEQSAAPNDNNGSFQAIQEPPEGMLSEGSSNGTDSLDDLPF